MLVVGGLCNAAGGLFRVSNASEDVGNLFSGVFGMIDHAGRLCCPHNPSEDAGSLCSGVLSLFDLLEYSKRVKPSNGLCAFSTLEFSVI